MRKPKYEQKIVRQIRQYLDRLIKAHGLGAVKNVINKIDSAEKLRKKMLSQKKELMAELEKINKKLK